MSSFSLFYHKEEKKVKEKEKGIDAIHDLKGGRKRRRQGEKQFRHKKKKIIMNQRMDVEKLCNIFCSVFFLEERVEGEAMTVRNEEGGRRGCRRG